MHKVGVIGFGYWGPNLVRNFNRHPNCTIQRIVDLDPRRRALVKAEYPQVNVADDFTSITRADDIDIVVIATPVFTHFELAMDALTHGKHVWIEKPMASNSEQCEKIQEAAQKQGRLVMVDHTYVYSPGVRQIKKYLDEGKLGDVLYYDATRVNLGLFQHDINVIWDLAPHDLSIIDYLFGSKTELVSATGLAHFGQPLEDVGYITLYSGQNFVCHLQLSWLSPVKIRQTLIGGSKSMIVWNDLSPDEAIKIYDSGVEIQNDHGVDAMKASYRKGMMFSPVLARYEPLAEAVKHFVQCIQSNESPVTDGKAGARVVRLLELADLSLKRNGAAIKV